MKIHRKDYHPLIRKRYLSLLLACYYILGLNSNSSCAKAVAHRSMVGSAHFSQKASHFKPTICFSSLLTQGICDTIAWEICRTLLRHTHIHSQKFRSISMLWGNPETTESGEDSSFPVRQSPLRLLFDIDSQINCMHNYIDSGCAYRDSLG